MTWIENIERWRQLPAEEKLLRRWRAIPRDVAQSMAFEGEAVDIPDASRNSRLARASRLIETKRAMLSNVEIALFLPDHANWSPLVEIWKSRLTLEHDPVDSGRASCQRQTPGQDERERTRQN